MNFYEQQLTRNFICLAVYKQKELGLRSKQNALSVVFCAARREYIVRSIRNVYIEEYCSCSHKQDELIKEH